ncbi:MAG: dTDP-4-dehydrorhamnose reductase [Deltaproteobacteria bacterium]|nr:dTDP-4-dehydrorhamnose reductase [Deltaproteobacteria bacterium]
MRVLVVGSGGQLGFELMRARWAPRIEVRGIDLPELDVGDERAVEAAVASVDGGVVVNSSAYTAVDKAETEEALAFKVNQDGPRSLAQACRRHNAALIHVSTDYVFDGSKSGAYTELDPTAPIGVYGRSKEAGERGIRRTLECHLILRTSWLYGIHGTNFVKTMLRLGRERDRLRVVDDQHGCPTAAQDLASAIVTLVDRIAAGDKMSWGTYHFANRGRTTWCNFARVILEAASRYTGRKVHVDAITTADYPTPAKRPANSELDTSRIEQVFGIRPAPWGESLQRVIAELFRGVETGGTPS